MGGKKGGGADGSAKTHASKTRQRLLTCFVWFTATQSLGVHRPRLLLPPLLLELLPLALLLLLLLLDLDPFDDFDLLLARTIVFVVVACGGDGKGTSMRYSSTPVAPVRKCL
jgi:hypothetical protein